MLKQWMRILSICLLTSTAQAQQPGPMPPGMLPPPVEQVLNDLSLSPAQRDTVRQTLLRQRLEREAADTDLRERHRAELAALLTPDQLVALNAVRPPPRGPRERNPQPQPQR